MRIQAGLVGNMYVTDIMSNPFIMNEAILMDSSPYHIVLLIPVK